MTITSSFIHLLGAIALLLWGLRMVRTGMMRGFGSRIRHNLGRSLNNRFKAYGMGLGVTALLQSSTATAMMTASFVGRGIITTAPALAALLGADMGSALVAMVLSLRIDWLSPLFILTGVTLFLANTTTLRRDIGRVFIGLGLLLMALQLVVGATSAMRQSPLAIGLIETASGEAFFALVLGALLTWLAHSSLAIIILIASLAHAGVLSTEGALALALGANIGGGLPAALATWKSEAAARRVTLSNLSFKTIMALVVLPFVGLIAGLLPWISADVGLQLLVFHMAFNFALGLAFLPMVRPVERWVERLIQDPPLTEDPTKPRYLDKLALDTPPLALAAAARETLRMGDTLEAMLRDTLTAFQTDDRNLVKDIGARDDIVDRLQEAIKLYLAQMSRDALGDEENRRAMEIITFATNLEHVGDIIDKNLMELAQKKIKKNMQFSEAGFAEIEKMHAELIATMRLSMAVFISDDTNLARQLIERKTSFRELERVAAENHIDRLRSGRLESIESSSLHLDILRDLKRINSHLTSAAYPILEAQGSLSKSRLLSA